MHEARRSPPLRGSLSSARMPPESLFLRLCPAHVVPLPRLADHCAVVARTRSRTSNRRIRRIRRSEAAMSDVRIESLHVYPVKGCRGIALDAADVATTGLAASGAGDREWMVVDARRTLRHAARASATRARRDAGPRRIPDAVGARRLAARAAVAAARRRVARRRGLAQRRAGLRRRRRRGALALRARLAPTCGSCASTARCRGRAIRTTRATRARTRSSPTATRFW